MYETSSSIHSVENDSSCQEISRVCYMNIRRIWTIRKYLALDATRTLIRALVISHLEYKSSMLYGIQDGFWTNFNWFKTPLREKLRKNEHITGVLKVLRSQWYGTISSERLALDETAKQNPAL